MTIYEPRHHEESVVVAADPEAVYDLVSDVTRTGEWSPVCEACWWDDPTQAGQVGAGFTGRNVTPQRTWQTHSRVTVADRGRAFVWEVGAGWVRWGFFLEPVDDGGAGTRVTQTWDFTTAGFERFAELYGDQAPEQVADRTRAAYEGMPVTLAAIRRILER